MTITGHGENTLMGCSWSRYRPIPHFIDPSCHLLAASRPLAQFGKAVRTDTEASAVGGDAGTTHACFSTASVSRPLARATVGLLSARSRIGGARRPARVIDRHASARHLPAATTDRLDDLADFIDHELWPLLVDVVAAVCVGDVLRVRHKVGEPFSARHQ